MNEDRLSPAAFAAMLLLAAGMGFMLVAIYNVWTEVNGVKMEIDALKTEVRRLRGEP